MGGKDIKGLTFNLLRKLMTDQLACSFSYVGGKRKEAFYDLQLRNIIFRKYIYKYIHTHTHKHTYI